MQAGTPFAQHGARVLRNIATGEDGTAAAAAMQAKAEAFRDQLSGGGSRVTGKIRPKGEQAHDPIPPIPAVAVLSIGVLTVADARARVKVPGADLSALWLEEHGRANGPRATVLQELRTAGYVDGTE